MLTICFSRTAFQQLFVFLFLLCFIFCIPPSLFNFSFSISFPLFPLRFPHGSFFSPIILTVSLLHIWWHGKGSRDAALQPRQLCTRRCLPLWRPNHRSQPPSAWYSRRALARFGPVTLQLPVRLCVWPHAVYLSGTSARLIWRIPLQFITLMARRFSRMTAVGSYLMVAIDVFQWSWSEMRINWRELQSRCACGTCFVSTGSL